MRERERERERTEKGEKLLKRRERRGGGKVEGISLSYFRGDLKVFSLPLKVCKLWGCRPCGVLVKDATTFLSQSL